MSNEQPPEDRMLAAMLETREIVYQLAEHFGISRAELNERAGVADPAGGA